MQCSVWDTRRRPVTFQFGEYFLKGWPGWQVQIHLLVGGTESKINFGKCFLIFTQDGG